MADLLAVDEFTDDLLPNSNAEFLSPMQEEQQQEEHALRAKYQGAGAELMNDQIQWLTDWYNEEMTIAGLQTESAVDLAAQVIAKNKIANRVNEKKQELVIQRDKYIKP